MKEKIWLEEMAAQGWFLKDIIWGVRYIFEKEEPKHMIYEIDRFNLSKNPSISEIKSKKEFLDMAEEMGWKVILHDEDLNYYFRKEYKEGDINELYNDKEARELHANKYLQRYQRVSFFNLKEFLIILFLAYPLQIIFSYIQPELVSPIFFLFWPILILLVFQMCFLQWMSKLYYQEFLLSKEEWIEEHTKKKNQKKVYRLIFRISKLKSFLEKESEGGFHIIQMGAVKYVLEKGEKKKYCYILDSKYLTNKRCLERKKEKFKDTKDWQELNNDWQIQSIEDAKKKGWEFVCALENRAILYRSLKIENIEALNTAKEERLIQIVSIIGPYGFKIIMAALIGGAIGFLVGSI